MSPEVLRIILNGLEVKGQGLLIFFLLVQYFAVNKIKITSQMIKIFPETGQVRSIRLLQFLYELEGPRA